MIPQRQQPPIYLKYLAWLLPTILMTFMLSGCAISESPIQHGGDQFLLAEQLIIGMLLVAVLVGIAARWFRVPYTLGLVLVGLILISGVRLEIEIPPNLILALLVPPLVFEAAFHLNLSDLRRNLAHILTLAILGVVLTMIISGGIVSFGTGLALPAALVFGALVAATDPVSVVALFRTMGMPKRLQVLLEGESLFNDGTAVVVFNIVLVLSLNGFRSFSWTSTVINFVAVSGGGLVVGLILGTIASEMISRIDDYLIETTLTSILAYGSYLVAELIGVSGVLAVVAAGLVNGNIGPRGMSPTTRIVVFNFWEYAAFLANSFVFLLIGLQIELASLIANWQLIFWAILSVLVARVITVYGLSWTGRDFPVKWQHVLYWGGLRGAIVLALALSLPASLGDSREQIKVMAFGVVLFTLLVQGVSMKSLVRWLKIVQRSEAQEEYERRHARAVASRTAYEHLRRRHLQGLITEHSWNILTPYLQEHTRSLTDAVRGILSSAPELEAEELDVARREYLRAQRSAVNSLRRDGMISDDIYEQLVTEIDVALTNRQVSWQELFGQTIDQKDTIKRLMAAVVQDQDVENAISSLTKQGILFTCLPSRSGFLSRRSTTLLVGLAKGQEEDVVIALEKSCKKRVVYPSYPMDGVDFSFPTPIAIKVGGATIFTFDVERFEVF